MVKNYNMLDDHAIFNHILTIERSMSKVLKGSPLFSVLVMGGGPFACFSMKESTSEVRYGH